MKREREMAVPYQYPKEPCPNEQSDVGYMPNKSKTAPPSVPFIKPAYELAHPAVFRRILALTNHTSRVKALTVCQSFYHLITPGLYENVCIDPWHHRDLTVGYELPDPPFTGSPKGLVNRKKALLTQIKEICLHIRGCHEHFPFPDQLVRLTAHHPDLGITVFPQRGCGHPLCAISFAGSILQGCPPITVNKLVLKTYLVNDVCPGTAATRFTINAKKMVLVLPKETCAMSIWGTMSDSAELDFAELDILLMTDAHLTRFDDLVSVLMIKNLSYDERTPKLTIYDLSANSSVNCATSDTSLIPHTMKERLVTVLQAVAEIAGVEAQLPIYKGRSDYLAEDGRDELLPVDLAELKRQQRKEDIKLNLRAADGGPGEAQTRLLVKELKGIERLSKASVKPQVKCEHDC